jgi:peroxiredoxin
MAWSKFQAGDVFPAMTLPRVGGGEIELGNPQGENDWQLVVVYRGKHCPLCSRYLGELSALIDRFHEIEVDVVALSGDPEEKARAHMESVGPAFPVAYGMSIDQMKTLGLYISHPRSAQETDRPFAEPGIFVINAEGKVQVTDISNAPFARPDLKTLASGLAFIRDPANSYPIRGTYE